MSNYDVERIEHILIQYTRKRGRIKNNVKLTQIEIKSALRQLTTSTAKEIYVCVKEEK